MVGYVVLCELGRVKQVQHAQVPHTIEPNGWLQAYFITLTSLVNDYDTS
jgi:hypothetical protein